MAASTSAHSELRKQAWDYFQLHAMQRLTIFNFYVVLCSAIAAAEVASFTKEFRLPGLPFLLGALLMIFSFIFWQLDDRNRLLIKNAEAALKYFESLDSEQIHVTHLFRNEEILTSDAESKGMHLKYSDCFRFIFAAFAAIGLLSVIAEVILFSRG